MPGLFPRLVAWEKCGICNISHVYYTGITRPNARWEVHSGAKLLFSIILDIDDDEREYAVKLSLSSID